MFVSYMVKTLAILYSITFFLLEKYVGAPFFAEAHLLGSLVLDQYFLGRFPRSILSI